MEEKAHRIISKLHGNLSFPIFIDQCKNRDGDNQQDVWREPKCFEKLFGTFDDYLVALRKLLRVESVISVNLYYITVL